MISRISAWDGCRTALLFAALCVVLPLWSAPPKLPAQARLSVGHGRTITEIAVSPDGRHLFTTDAEQICVWDIETGKELRVIGRHKDTGQNFWPLGVGFAPTESWVLITDDAGLTVYDAKELRLLKVFPARGERNFTWDVARRTGYFAGAFPYQASVDTDSVLKLTQQTARRGPGSPEKMPQGPQRIIVLPGDRLLLDCHPGWAILDAVTWEASRSDAEDWRDFLPAQDGFVLAARTEPAARSFNTELQLLNATDLSIVAKKPFSGLVHFPGRAAYDDKTKAYWGWADGKLRALDAASLEERRSIDLSDELGKMENVRVIIIPQRRLFAVANGSRVNFVDMDAGKVVRILGDRIFSAQRIAASPEGSELLATDERGTVKRLRFLSSGIVVKNVPVTTRALVYDPLGEEIAFSEGPAAAIVIAQRSQFPAKDFEIRSANFQAGANDVVFSPDDGAVFAMSDGYAIAAVSRQDGSTLLSHVLQADRNQRGRMALSPGGRWLVSYGPLNRITGFDLHARKQAWVASIDGPREAFAFIGPDTFACVRPGALEYRSASTGDVLFENPLETTPGEFGFVGAVSADQTRLAYYDGKVLRVVDAETGDALLSVPTPPVRDLAFLGKVGHVVVAGQDNLLRIFDIAAKKEVCALATFIGDDEWVASAPDSRFDASEKSIGKLYLVKGTEVLPLESMFERLYTPRLLANLLAGERLEPLPIDVTELKPAPTVTVTLADGTRNLRVEDDDMGTTVRQEKVALKITAQARGSKVVEVRLFQNGKLVHSSPGTQGESGNFDIEAQLLPGENRLRLVAVNDQRTESAPAELPLVYEPAQKPAGEPPGGGLQLHLLVVGVNAYQNPKYNLNYAEADAKAVRAAIEAATKTIFTGVKVHTLLNDEVRKSSVLDQIRAIAAAAGRRDVFVFYYAGHGVMTSGPKPEFFLVPHDVTQLYGADDALRQKGLSSAELTELSKIIPAQKQLFILDACQSAGALKDVAMRGAAEEKAIAQLARSTGTHWLTASGSEQFASEFEKLGHGAFTYVLLEALQGKADTGDGRVTVNELKAYLEAQVPEVTQKYKGTPQFPSSYGFGQDFPVAVVK